MRSAVCFVILTNQRPALWRSSQSEAGMAAPAWWRLGICIVIDSRRVSNLHNQSANKSLLATLCSTDLLWYLITSLICNPWVRTVCCPGEIPLFWFVACKYSPAAGSGPGGKRPTQIYFAKSFYKPRPGYKSNVNVIGALCQPVGDIEGIKKLIYIFDP